MNSDRAELRAGILSSGGYGDWQLTPFAADASFRRYFRLRRDSNTVLLMDAPPPQEDVNRFRLIADHLRRCGVRSPKIHAVDEKHGFLIIEDFGDKTFTKLLQTGAPEETLYALAIDALVALHSHPLADQLCVDKYSPDIRREELMLFVEWFYPAATGRVLTITDRTCFLAVWDQVWCSIPPPRQTLVLRDFHVDNLMQVGRGTAVENCGLLDFQDALIGPQSFDVASLLEDARRDVSGKLVQKMLSRYKTSMAKKTDVNFDIWYQVTAAHRHLRVLGVFVRLWKRDSKTGYLRHLPRVARLLLSHRDVMVLAPVYEWLESHIPNLLDAAIRISPNHA